mgnify:CR=1 FL=1
MVVPACANEVDHAEAVAAFTRFQGALQRRDVEGCRTAITRESAAALGAMPWDRVAARRYAETSPNIRPDERAGVLAAFEPGFNPISLLP